MIITLKEYNNRQAKWYAILENQKSLYCLIEDYKYISQLNLELFSPNIEELLENQVDPSTFWLHHNEYPVTNITANITQYQYYCKVQKLLLNYWSGYYLSKADHAFLML